MQSAQPNTTDCTHRFRVGVPTTVADVQEISGVDEVCEAQCNVCFEFANHTVLWSRWVVVFGGGFWTRRLRITRQSILTAKCVKLGAGHLQAICGGVAVLAKQRRRIQHVEGLSAAN